MLFWRLTSDTFGQIEGIITGREPIAEQLEKVDLENKNRGRHPTNPKWKEIDPRPFLIQNGEKFDIKTRK